MHLAHSLVVPLAAGQEEGRLEAWFALLAHSLVVPLAATTTTDPQGASLHSRRVEARDASNLHPNQNRVLLQRKKKKNKRKKFQTYTAASSSKRS